MSLIKWGGTEICFAEKSVLTGPYEAEILLNQPWEKIEVFVVVVK